MFFRFFLVFLIGWPIVLVAEDSKSFNGKNKIDTQQVVYVNDKNSPQSQASDFERGTSLGEGKIESKNKVGHSESTYGFITDIKKSDPVGFIERSAESFPQIGMHKTRQVDDFSSSKSALITDTLSGVGTYDGMNKPYEGDGYSFSDRFQEGVRTELGEDVYEKAVWIYAEINSVDKWINSTVAQYGFGEGSLLGKQKYSIVGLDGLLNVMVIFQQGDGVSLVSEGGGNRLWKTAEEGEKSFLNEGYQDRLSGAKISDSKFSILLKYLTIINLIYSFSAIVFVVIVARVFKFLVRQQ